MLTIAAGVCLGIVAAVYALNWLGEMAERRQQRAYRKMMRAAMMTPEQRELAATDRAIGITLLIIVVVTAAVYFIAPH
jgi:hypothetical protein